MRHTAEGLTTSVKHAHLRPIKTGDSVYIKRNAVSINKETSPVEKSVSIKVKTHDGECVILNPKPLTVVGTGGFANTVHVCNSTNPSELHKYVAAHGLVHADEIDQASSETVLNKLSTIDRVISGATVDPKTSSIVHQITPMIASMKNQVNNLNAHSPQAQSKLQSMNKQVDNVLSLLAKPKTGGRRRFRQSRKFRKSSSRSRK